MYTFNLRSVIFVTTLLAAPLLVGSANATVTSKLSKCKLDSRDKATECCNQIMRQAKKVPMWWPTESRSCSNSGVVVCASGKCWVDVHATNTGSRRSSNEGQLNQEAQNDRPASGAGNAPAGSGGGQPPAGGGGGQPPAGGGGITM
jgi:hypothetical protein